MKELDIPAKWIWCAGEQRPKNFYLHVRKAFEIRAGLRRASVRVTADSRYILFINGIPVGHGPARCDRRWQCVDEWDCTGELRQGDNVIAALVHHYGEWTFSYMLGRGGFLADAEIVFHDGQAMHVGTDGSWRVQPAHAWGRSLPRMSIQLGFPEVYDARQAPEGWAGTAYDDSGWEPATVLGPAGMEPWPHLVQRDIPAMREIPMNAERVIDTGEVGIARTGHYVDLLRVVWNTSHAVAYLATFVWSPDDMDAEIHAGSQEAIRLWVNGELLISHLVTRDPAPDQEIVPLRLRSGWNPVLAKIVQGEGQWHFYFRIEGTGSESLVYSSTPGEASTGADTLKPWWLLGPFDSESVKDGFESHYPPEDELVFGKAYRGKNGQEIRWISAGVTSESMLTAVIMSREGRFPAAPGVIENPDGLVHPGTSAIISPGAEHGVYAVIDFGKEVTGYPVIEIDRALGGEIIDLGYSEVLQTHAGEVLSPLSGSMGIVNPDRAGVHNADRYICRAGRQRFQTFDKRAFRYLQLDVRKVKQPLAVGPVSLVLSTYPVDYRGSFTCSDTMLNKIWEVGRWTVQLNMEDAYTDCPWRERGQWWGDVRVQALVNYYAFGDLALARQGLRHMAQSQLENGLTMGIYPTDWSNGILPTFTLLWVISLLDYYQFSGDRVLVEELFPSVERALAYFERYRSEHDLLRDVPHWLFVDWADVETAGESASINALYYGGLGAGAALADVLSERDKSGEYRRLADLIRVGMGSHLWDGGVTCFRDAGSQETVGEKISEQANCWAVAFDVARDQTAQSIMNALASEDGASVRVATPYFGFYMLAAFATTGRHTQALDYVRAHWGAMLDWGATSWWEQWEPKASFCHGWSSAPTHFLQAEILGVKPGKPGWEEILIEPHPAGLSEVRGSVPTPRGMIRVDWKLEDDFRLVVEIPAPATVTIPPSKKGVVTVTKVEGGRPTETVAGGPPGNAGQRRAKDRRFTVVLPGPGIYQIRST